MTSSETAWPAGHTEGLSERVGLLLLNLGTPDGTDYRSLRRYLSEFLSDRRVVELSPWLWQPILQGIVLTLRPRKSARAYHAIWDREQGDSPLRLITRAQAEKLAARLGAKFPGLEIDWAMRYGRPSVAEKLEGLIARGCRRLVVFPLYPQYSAATTATACDEVFRVLMRQRWQPALRSVPAYYDAPAYIAALANSVRRALAGLMWEPEVVLASFHGLPKENIEKGDPYQAQCLRTGQLLREELGWDERRLRITFQSRFGPKEWLTPYSDVTVRQLAGEGVKGLAVLSPGFAADCVETLEEVDIGLRETFRAHGGENFAYIPCLNDGDEHIDLLERLALGELSGWL